MRKQFLVMFCALVLFSGFAFGEEAVKESNTALATEGMIFSPGTSVANIGIGTYFSGLGLCGGFDHSFGKFNIASFPFSYGAAGRVSLGISSDMYVTAAALGTLHFYWGALNFGIEWLNHLETYWGLGLGVNITPDFGLGITSIGGFNYYFTDDMAVNLESGLAGTYLGVMKKL